MTLVRTLWFSKLRFGTLLAVLTVGCTELKEAVLVFEVANEKVELAGSDIVEVHLSEALGGDGWSISFKMSKKQAILFGKLTEKHVGLPMSMLLCGKLLSSPVIREPIYGGAAMFSAGLDLAVAKQYENQLSSGSCLKND